MGGYAMKRSHRIFAALILAVLVFLTGCTGGGAREERTFFGFDTVCSVSFYKGGNQSILTRCEELLQEHEWIFDRFDEDGLIFAINNFAEPVMIDYAVADCIRIAKEYNEISGGLFDITLAPIMDMYGFGSDEPSVPDEEMLKVLLSTMTGMDKLQVDESDMLIKPFGVQMDLGAIAKGYTADRMRELLEDSKVRSAIINLGGNVVVMGDKDGEPFSVGIQYPFEADGTSIAAVLVSDASVVTSGIYQRYFEKDGKIYHHIIDPTTGRPADTDLYSATIITDSAAKADAMSTVCMLLGAEKAMELIENTAGFEAVFVTNENEVIYTSGLEGKVTVTK